MQIDAFENQYNINEEPFFLYDDSGVVLTDGLWYVVMPDKVVVQEWTDSSGDSGYSIDIEVYRIKE